MLASGYPVDTEETYVLVLYSQKTVGFLELLGIFLILCIGADDIFVFTDTWKVSKVVEWVKVGKEVV